MNALEWLKAPNRAAIRPVCVVFGDDAFLVRESITAVGHAVFPEEDRVRESAALREQPHRSRPCWMKCGRCLLQPHPAGDRRGRRSVRHQVPQGPGSLRREALPGGDPALQVKRGPRPPGWRRFEKSGLPIDCSSPKEVDLVPWISQIASARFDAQLDAAEARLLLELVGPESGILVAELEKLSIYAAETKRINKKDILKLVGAGRVETIWKTLDAALAGQSLAPRSSTSTLSSPTAKSRSGCSPR